MNKYLLHSTGHFPFGATTLFTIYKTYKNNWQGKVTADRDEATFGKRKGVALLKRKAKAVAMATTAVKSDKDKKDKYKPSDGVPAAGGTTRAGSSRLERQATVEVNLDKLIEEEVAAQMTLEDAAGSTSETGHLFTWVAQILGAACKLHAKEQVARHYGCSVEGRHGHQGRETPREALQGGHEGGRGGVACA